MAAPTLAVLGGARFASWGAAVETFDIVDVGPSAGTEVFVAVRGTSRTVHDDHTWDISNSGDAVDWEVVHTSIIDRSQTELNQLRIWRGPAWTGTKTITVDPGGGAGQTWYGTYHVFEIDGFDSVLQVVSELLPNVASPATVTVELAALTADTLRVGWQSLETNGTKTWSSPPSGYTQVDLTANLDNVSRLMTSTAGGATVAQEVASTTQIWSYTGAVLEISSESAAELAADSSAGATLAAGASSVAELAADSGASATLVGSGEVGGVAELAADSTASATLTGSAEAVVELAVDSSASATLVAVASAVAELAADSGTSATLAGTAGQVAPLAAESTAAATLTASASAIAELAAVSGTSATLVGVGNSTSAPAELAAMSSASATLTASALGPADPHPITITIRDEGHTVTIREG